MAESASCIYFPPRFLQSARPTKWRCRFGDDFTDDDALETAQSLWGITPPLCQRRNPVMSKQTEREGYVPNVLYTCGALLHGRELIIPYAMSDSATSFATVPLDELLAVME